MIPEIYPKGLLYCSINIHFTTLNMKVQCTKYCHLTDILLLLLLFLLLLLHSWWRNFILEQENTEDSALHYATNVELWRRISTFFGKLVGLYQQLRIPIWIKFCSTINFNRKRKEKHSYYMQSSVSWFPVHPIFVQKYK